MENLQADAFEADDSAANSGLITSKAAGAMAALAGGGFLLPQDTLSRIGVRRTVNSPAKEWFLNRALRVDDVAEALYSGNRRVPTYTKSQITPLRIPGRSQETTGPNVDIPATTESSTPPGLFIGQKVPALAYYADTASLRCIADFSTKCFWRSPAGDHHGHSQKRSFSHSGIQLRVDSKPSHSVYECSSADTQSDCSAIRTAYAAPACGKRLYDFLALLPFVLLSTSVDIRS